MAKNGFNIEVLHFHIAIFLLLFNSSHSSKSGFYKKIQKLQANIFVEANIFYMLTEYRSRPGISVCLWIPRPS
jgi:hypothetical protein